MLFKKKKKKTKFCLVKRRFEVLFSIGQNKHGHILMLRNLETGGLSHLYGQKRTRPRQRVIEEWTVCDE